jgi:hypothetical protein
MKYTYINTLAAIAGLALTATSANAATSLLAVDFGSLTSVESGFVGQAVDNFTHTTTGGDINVAISGYQGLVTGSNNGGTNADLFDDFYFKNGGTMTVILSGDGISADTDYDMTFWAYYSVEARDTTIAGSAGTTGTSLGPIAFVVPTSLSDNSASGTFTSDGTGTLTFAVSGSASRPALNGFTITAVPEPSTTALLGLGGLALILRRRK